MKSRGFTEFAVKSFFYHSLDSRKMHANISGKLMDQFEG